MSHVDMLVSGGSLMAYQVLEACTACLHYDGAYSHNIIFNTTELLR